MGFLRFYLALSVVAFHLDTIFAKFMLTGLVSVKSFFILSGFYMALILNKKYLKLENSYQLFIINRFLRIYPAYWIILFLTMVVSLYNVVHLAMHRNVVELVVKNVTIFFNLDFFMYDPSRYEGLFVYQSWSLGIELIFYLVAPFIVKRHVTVIISLLLFSIALRIFLWQTHLFYPAYYFDHFFIPHIPFFTLGILSYHIYIFFEKVSIQPRILIALFIFTLSIAILYPMLLTHSYITEWGYYFLLTILIPFCFRFSNIFQYDKILGDLSYPIYISHTFVISTMSLFFVLSQSEWLKLVTLLLTIALSYVLHKQVQEKIDIYRHKRIK